VYIAQPPLYKVKRGKQEDYLLDDTEMSASLLRSALDNALLHVDAEAPPLGSVALETLMSEFQVFRSMLARMSTRYDPAFLTELLNLPRINADQTELDQPLSDWCQALETSLRAQAGPAIDYRVSLVDDEDGTPYSIEVTRLVHGIPETHNVSLDFFGSADYLRIATLAEKLDGLVRPGAYVVRGERRREVGSFTEAFDWLLAEGRRGYHIQRYKGLGEMNPDQLWETTMDPDTRRLLRVTIEDAVAADQIFTTLMGEQVEPRREFIERNALDAENIDI
jgi:DNA gyrase subunit B